MGENDPLRRVAFPANRGPLAADLVPDQRAEPDLKWVPIDMLRVDDRYQRKLAKTNWQSIEKIARAFDWARFVPLMVAPGPDGELMIIVGQHRAHAALMAGHDRVPAMIVPLEVSEQAAAFGWINGQVTQITAFNLLKAALVAGDSWAQASVDAVEAAGCRLMTYRVPTLGVRAGMIMSVMMVRREIEAGRGERLTMALDAVRQSPTGSEVEAWSSGFLSSWLAVCNETGMSRATMDKVLANLSARKTQLAVDRMRNDKREYALQSRTAILRRILTDLHGAVRKAQA